MEPSLSSVMLIPLAAVVAALLAHVVGRVVRVPLVVFEILLGILLGPDLLGWVEVTEFASTVADLGLVMLFFLAGNEIDMEVIAGRPLRRATGGWLISLALGLLIGLAVAPDAIGAGFVGVALASTALGTLLPILRDAGELRTPLGVAVTAVGSVGEFGPLLAISLFLSGRNPGTETLFLLGFAAVAGGLLLFAARGRHVRLHRAIEATMHTTGQFAMRLVILLIALLAGLSAWLDIDMLLGGFTAGLVFNLLMRGVDPRLARDIESKLDAIGYGLLVPVFFISTGLKFDLDALVDDTRALVVLPVFVISLLIVRGCRRRSPRHRAPPAGSGGPWSCSAPRPCR